MNFSHANLFIQSCNNWWGCATILMMFLPFFVHCMVAVASATGKATDAKNSNGDTKVKFRSHLAEQLADKWQHLPFVKDCM